MPVIDNIIREERVYPKVGESYHFYDDGKLYRSRHHIATVSRILPINETRQIINPETKMTLYETLKQEIQDHDWLYEQKMPERVIELSIPTYDEDPIYAIPEKQGGWFSIDFTDGWQGGALDVSGTLTEIMDRNYKESEAWLKSREQFNSEENGHNN